MVTIRRGHYPQSRIWNLVLLSGTDLHKGLRFFKRAPGERSYRTIVCDIVAHHSLLPTMISCYLELRRSGISVSGASLPTVRR